MKVADETTAKEAIDMWRNKAPKEQLRHIRLAIEILELNQMHYENRGNEKGIIRSDNKKEHNHGNCFDRRNRFYR